MNPELITAINRLADAHAKLADNVGRLADCFTHVEGRIQDQTFAEALLWQLQMATSALDTIGEKMPEVPENED